MRIVSLSIASALAAATVVGCGGGAMTGHRGARSTTASFAALQRRALDLPTLRLSPPFGRGVPGRCYGGPIGARFLGLPGIPGTVLGPGRGEPKWESGPVYVGFRGSMFAGALPVAGSRWRAIQTIWISRPSYGGPVVIRGGRLDRGGTVLFGLHRPKRELPLPPTSWPSDDIHRVGGADRALRGRPRAGWRATAVETRVRTPGCYAFRVDGQGFNYLIPFAVVKFQPATKLRRVLPPNPSHEPASASRLRADPAGSQQRRGRPLDRPVRPLARSAARNARGRSPKSPAPRARIHPEHL